MSQKTNMTIVEKCVTETLKSSNELYYCQTDSQLGVNENQEGTI